MRTQGHDRPDQPARLRSDGHQRFDFGVGVSLVEEALEGGVGVGERESHLAPRFGRRRFQQRACPAQDGGEQRRKPLALAVRPERVRAGQRDDAAQQRRGDAEADQVPVAGGRFRQQHEERRDQRDVDSVVEPAGGSAREREHEEQRGRLQMTVHERREQRRGDGARHRTRDALQALAQRRARVRLQHQHGSDDDPVAARAVEEEAEKRGRGGGEADAHGVAQVERSEGKRGEDRTAVGRLDAQLRWSGFADSVERGGGADREAKMTQERLERRRELGVLGRLRIGLRER